MEIDWNGVWHILLETINEPLFEIDGKPVKIVSILIFIGTVLASVWISKIVQRAVRELLTRLAPKNALKIDGFMRLIHYTVMLLGLALGLKVIGIDLSLLFAAGAIFAVGFGFAMQNIAQNFVSGVILLVEGAINPGDILEVEGRVVRITKVGIRATRARTRDDEDLIIPNSALVQSPVTNYTLSDSLYRVKATVGVAYESDMKQVREVLEEAAAEIRPQIERMPRVLMTAFADSSVNFEVSIWTDDPWRERLVRSDLLETVWWALKRQDITIAFPQLDLHLDTPVAEAFAGKKAVS